MEIPEVKRGVEEEDEIWFVNSQQKGVEPPKISQAL